MKPKRPPNGYIAERARAAGVDPRLVQERMRLKGWPFELAVKVPPGNRYGLGCRVRYMVHCERLRRA